MVQADRVLVAAIRKTQSKTNSTTEAVAISGACLSFCFLKGDIGGAGRGAEGNSPSFSSAGGARLQETTV